VVAALVLYKTLVKNAWVYREWAEWYKWARDLVEKQEFTVSAGDIERLREAHRRLEEVAEEVMEELNAVLARYSQSDFYKERPDLLNKLKQLLEVDVEKAEELAEASRKRLSDYSDAGMGTKAYAALLSIARGGIYGHAAMLLMIEGALADIVLSAPRTAYGKAKDVANARGETVDPSRSRRGAVDWEDRAASVLLRFLIGYGEADLKFRPVEKGDRKGFQVFRTFGGVEAFVGELWIRESTAYFKVSKEELRRFMEEAKRTAPDLSGFDKAPQYLEWLATDVTTAWRQIVGITARPWQLRWYIALLGEEESFSGRGNATKEGINLSITAYWPREREDEILKKSKWLESLLGQRVESWRQLVDAIDWSWVLKKVEEMAGALKPWIGPEKMNDVEREELMRRMLGELALFVHFAEARKGKDDGEWREERAKMLAKAVEDLSGGRIAGDFAKELARLIIYHAEGRKQYAEKHINKLAEKLVGVSNKEVWDIVRRVLSGEDPYVYCLVNDCARDAVVRKFVAPALELIMLDKALRRKSDREETLLIFGEMYATALAGDGTVGRRRVGLTVGGELGGGATLLRLATLYLLNKLLPKELKFNARIYVQRDTVNNVYYNITATSENAAKLMRLLAVSAPSAGGEYLSPKFNKFVEEARVEVRVDNIRRTKKDHVTADLTISEGGVVVKYNVYLRDNAIRLQFASTNRSRAELAARLLRHVGVAAEVRKADDRDVWYVHAHTDRLAAGREELRKAIAKVVEAARDNDSVNEKKARRWLKKLESGLTLMEGWPKYHVALVRGGALVVKFASPNPDSIVREAQRLRDMGLVEGVHFTVKMPEGGKAGYVSILKEGLAHAAWLSVNGKDEQQRLAADFVKIILQRAKERGEEVRKKAEEIVEEGKAWGSLTLKDFEKEVEVDGRRHVVKVIDGGAELEKSESGKLLLRIKITAEVDGVKSEYTITYGRHGKDNAAVGRAYAKVDGGEVDAERLSALIKALTGKEPRVYRMKDGKITIQCGREHLEGFMRFEELVETILKWLVETSRR
jgi:hypothetical protein